MAIARSGSGNVVLAKTIPHFMVAIMTLELTTVSTWWPRADKFQHVPHPGLHVVNHHAHADSPRVVLVHGAPDRSKSFAHVVHRLPDLAVTVYDRRGYGKSLDAAWNADRLFSGGFAVHADDLIDMLDGRPSVVVGQSAGG